MNQVTFEEVYANAYIRQSINVILRNTTRKYPILENQIDDIRQDLLLSLNKNLGKFNPAKGNIEYFFRMVLDFKIREIIKKLYTNKSIFERTFINCNVLEDVINQLPYEQPLKELELQMDVKIVISALESIDKKICEMIMDGYSLRTIAKKNNIPLNDIQRIYLPRIKKSFELHGIIR